MRYAAAALVALLVQPVGFAAESSRVGLIEAARLPESLAAESLAAEVESEEVRIVLRRRGPSNGIESGGLESIRVKRSDATRVLKEYRAQPKVELAVLDQRKHRHAVPNDSLFSDQWYLQNAEPAAIGATVAWDTTTGSAGTVVAVLDTGVRFDHPDLARASATGKLLPGYDFISGDSGSSTQFFTANDGDGRDADPTDPGDWVDSNDHRNSFFSACDIENSSWHGTRVAGLIGAASNNGNGIAGTAWQTWILPVRVLGKCGGYDLDILEGMRWAAGLHVSGVPDNPYPANIINLSLGSDRLCSSLYAGVIEELMQRGVTVIASGGNSGGPVEEPANCPGVVAVAGLRHAGTKVGYSSLGPEIAVAAPAGNCVNLSGACLFSLHTTVDSGRLTPVGPSYTDQFNTNLGTSFSAPLASGVGALMHAVNGRLHPRHVLARLRASARTFPDGGATPPPTCHVPTGSGDVQLVECVCTTNTCGSGMLSAPNAVAAAQRPIAHIVTPTTIVAGGLLNIDGSSSSAACGRTIASYAWSLVSSQGTSAPVPSNADQPIVQVSAPVSGSYILRLTVTDNLGASDSGDIEVMDTSSTSTTTAPLNTASCPSVITPPPVPPPTPPDPPAPPPEAAPPVDGGGGGGSIGGGLLLVLLALWLASGRTYATAYFRPNSSCRSS